MPAFYGDEQKRRVLAAVDLVQLVSEYTPVRKAGANFTCCCLFHSERTPSMYIYQADQHYHCFGCGVHGDALDLLMTRDRLTFTEALEALARRAGITLVPAEGAEAHAQERGVRERQLKAMEFACRFYEAQLWSPAGEAALAYLRGRGLDDAAIREFRLGWAPGGSALVEEVRRRRADPAVLGELDLAVARDGSGLRDRFYARVTFPICDRLGNPIAFSARVLPEAERRAKEEGRSVGKYINSTDTPLYHKGRTVFNLHRARTALREERRLLVMEGPTDVMAAWQAGVRGCVAVLGTAFTPEHARALGQAASGGELILLFDGDRAGQTNSVKAVKTCLAAGIAARVAVLPDELDPSELLAEGGGAGGRARLDQVLDAAREDVRHLLLALAPAPHAMARDAKLDALRELAAAIAAMPDPTARTLARQQAEQWMNIALPSGAAAAARAVEEPDASAAPGCDGAADAVLHILIQHPELRGRAGDDLHLEPATWVGPWAAVAAALLCEPDADAQRLRALPEAADPVVRQRLGWWLATPLPQRMPPIDDPVAALHAGARSLAREQVSRRLALVRAELTTAEQAGDHAAAARLFAETNDLARTLADL